jgi:NADH dehydrogenase
MTTKIIIIGGGFGGLEAAFSLSYLKNESTNITLIDRKEYHAFIPSIHEIISGKTRARDIQIPLLTVLNPAGITYLCDEVLSIDRKRKKVLTEHKELEYDYLILCFGAKNSFFDVAGADKYAYRFRSPEDAERIRDDLNNAMDHDGFPLRLVLAGGGTEGVEVAGELLDAISDSGHKQSLNSGAITIEIIQKNPRLLPEFPEKAQICAEEYLGSRGVIITTESRIVGVEKETLMLDSGSSRDVSMFVWTGGIKPSRLIDGLDLPKDDQGWLIVNEQLHSPADSTVFAVGDIIIIQGKNGNIPLPRLAYHALDQAVIASHNIYNLTSGRRPVSYVPKSKPQLISMGRDMGIMIQNAKVFTGQWVNVMKKVIQARHLMTYLTKPALIAATPRIPGREYISLSRSLFPL